MNKDPGRKIAPKGARGWDGERTAYRCVDGTNALVPGRPFRRDPREQGTSGKTRVQTRYVNCVSRVGVQKVIRPVVSGIEFSRDMSRITWGANVKTLAFPGTVREVQDHSFCRTAVRVVVLNERLKTLGEYRGNFTTGCFSCTRLR